ncbi:MAG: carbohydrate kinase [Rhizobiales bacterium]|nr:carbohydrate kinase [Hyphomicrobiales bacterium]
MSFVLACDIGGTRMKAALIDEKGDFVARESAPSPQPVGEATEVDADLWTRGFFDLTETLARADAAAFSQVAAIAVTAVTRTQIFLDAALRPLRPAILWGDVRAATLIPELADLSPGDHPERERLNAFHPLARLRWLQRAEPDKAARLAHVIEPKDFINLRLTGAPASDSVSMARLAAATAKGRDGRSLLDACGLPARLAPTLLRPATALGRTLPALPGALGRLAGAPVIMTGNDTWTAVLGLGALRPGLAYNISGTTEVLGLIADHAASAEGLMTVDWGEGLTQIGGPSQTGGDALAWLSSIARDATVGGTSASPEALLFLPFLQGERVPYWNPDLRGAFLGLHRSHGPDDLRRAVLEGVALLNRVVLTRAERAAGLDAADIRMGGGGATPEWAQIKADILQRPLAVSAEPEPGLLGAAIAAFAALGSFPSLAAAQDALARPASRHMPNLAKARDADRLFRLFEDAHAAVAPLSARLAAWTRGGG